MLLIVLSTALSSLDLDDFLASTLTSTSKKRSHDAEPEYEAPKPRKVQEKDKSTGKKAEKPVKGSKDATKKAIGGKPKGVSKAGSKAAKAGSKAGEAGDDALEAAPAAPAPAKDRNISVTTFQRRHQQPAEGAREVFDVAVEAAVPHKPVDSTLSQSQLKSIRVSLFLS